MSIAEDTTDDRRHLLNREDAAHPGDLTSPGPIREAHFIQAGCDATQWTATKPLDWLSIQVSTLIACAFSDRFAAAMMETTPFLPGLSPVAGKQLTAQQDAGNLSSNGGLVLLREFARRSQVASVIAGPLPDTRNQQLVIHSHADMVTARMMAISAGYEDGDDLDALRHDPALLIACDRRPEGGHDIPSQPTISRLENLADARTLYKIGMGFVDFFCRSYATPPKRIELDIDDTDDRVHGGQQLALFNAHVGDHCFKPIHIFEAISGKPILSLLRPGKRPSGEEIAVCSGT